MSPLTVAVAQPVVAPGDLVASVVHHADAVRSASARLVVFPEMSITGYDLAAPDVDVSDPALAPLVATCAEAGATALVGAPVAEPEGRYIATLVVDADGVGVAYRKAFPGSDELTSFSAGSGASVIEVDGWRVGLGICRDTRIDEHLAETLACGIDLYVAGLVHADDDVEELGIRATRIARRGGIPVAFASAAGWSGPGYPSCAGHSAIWSADGSVLSAAGFAVGEVRSVELHASDV